jgi:predicted membrane-bound mannosyltransferase
VSSTAPAEFISYRVWIICVIAILLIAAFLRMYDLPLVPFHHDEGVNGNFLVRLVRENQYKYDPENYHGPTIYYLTAVIPWILKTLFGAAASETYGLNTTTARMVTAVFGFSHCVVASALSQP